MTIRPHTKRRSFQWSMVPVPALTLLACLFYALVYAFVGPPYSGVSIDGQWVVTSIDTCDAHPGWCETNDAGPRGLQVGDRLVAIGDLTSAAYRGDRRLVAFAGSGTMAISDSRRQPLSVEHASLNLPAGFPSTDILSAGLALVPGGADQLTVGGEMRQPFGMSAVSSLQGMAVSPALRTMMRTVPFPRSLMNTRCLASALGGGGGSGSDVTPQRFT